MNALAFVLDASITSRLCLMLLHSLWQFTVLATLVHLVDRFCPRLSDESRYSVYLAALLLGLLVLPVTLILIAQAPVGHPVVAENLEAAGSTAFLSATMTGKTGSQTADVAPREASAPNDAVLAPAFTSVDLSSAAFTRWIAAAYLAGVLLMLVRLSRGLWISQRLVARAQELESGALVDVLRRLATRWQLAVVPKLAVAEDLAMPCLVGLLRPTVLFPAAVLNGMTPAQLELILTHELAHVRRYDLWIQLLQRLAEAFLFFNPAVWYLNRRISFLRELCCDQAACGAAAPVKIRLMYAESLLHLLELQRHRWKSGRVDGAADIAALAAAGSSPSQLRRRVAALLGEPIVQPLRLSRSGVLVLVALMTIMLGAPAVVMSTIDGAPAATGQEQQGDPGDTRTATEPAVEGAPIEIVAIGSAGGGVAQGWWDADGNALKEVSFSLRHSTLPALEPGVVALHVVFKVPQLTPDDSIRFHSSFVSPMPVASWSSRGEVLGGDGKPLPNHFHEVFTLPADIKVFTLRVGLAAKPWETVYTGNTEPASFGSADGKGIVLSGAFDSALPFGAGTRIFVSHNWYDDDARLLAIDQTGKSHKAGRVSQMVAAGTVNQWRYEFRDLKVADIERFDFQVRPIAWTVRDNLPTRPKPPADAKATISGRIMLADGSPATQEGWLHFSRKGKDGNGLMGTEGSFKDRYTFSVSAGTVWLAHFTDNFAPAIAGPYELQPGERLDDVDLVLNPGVTAYLQFENEAGDPIPAQVVAVPYLGKDSCGPSKPHSADTQGRLALGQLAEGSAYSLAVGASGYQSRTLDLVAQVANLGTRDAPVVIKLPKARPATGVVLLSGGEPVKGAVLKKRIQIGPGPRQIHSGQIAATADAQGRFTVDQLVDDAWYLFLAEAPHGARVMVPPFQAGQTNLRVVLPPRRDLMIHVIGRLNDLPLRNGKPFLGVRQPYLVSPTGDASYADLLGHDVAVTPSPEGGTAEYLGLIDAPVQIIAGQERHEFTLEESQTSITVRLRGDR